MTCKKCNAGNMVEKTNKSTGSVFWACDRWPDCNNTERVEPKETTDAEPKYPATVKEGYKEVRISCLKAAVEFLSHANTINGRDKNTEDVMSIAEKFEKWVNR